MRGGKLADQGMWCALHDNNTAALCIKRERERERERERKKERRAYHNGPCAASCLVAAAAFFVATALVLVSRSNRAKAAAVAPASGPTCTL
jgi:hypothetical protein